MKRWKRSVARVDLAPALAPGTPPVSDSTRPMLWPLIGMVLGLLFLAGSLLESKWFVFLFLGSVILAASLAVRDRKGLFLALLPFTIPIGTDLNLYFQQSPFHRSTYGFLIQLSYLPLIMLLGIWVFRSISERKPFGLSTRGLGCAVGFFCAAVLSVLLSQNRLYGLFDLFALLCSLTMFEYMASEVRSPRELRIILTSLSAAVALQGLIAVGQYITNSTLGLEFLGAYQASQRARGAPIGLLTLTRVGGTIGHPNELAKFFDLSIPICFALLFTPLRGIFRPLVAVAVTVGIVGLTMTLSRGGLVAVLLGIVAILVYRVKAGAGLLRAVAAAILIGIFIVAIAVGTENPVQRRLLKDDYRAAFARVPLMKVAFNMIADRPFFGVGLNSYNEEARRYDNTPQAITTHWNAPVHNLPLFIMAETGAVGLIWFLLFLFVIFRWVVSAIGTSDPFISWASLGLLIGLLAFLAHCQIEFDHIPRNTLFWFLAGLGVSLSHLDKTAPERFRAPGHLAPQPVRVI